MAVQLTNQHAHQFKAQVAVALVIEAFRKAYAVVAHGDMHPITHRAEPHADPPLAVAGLGVLERIADELIQNEATRAGLVKDQ